MKFASFGECRLLVRIPKQAISARERALCQLCVLSFRVEVTEKKETKVVVK